MYKHLYLTGALSDDRPCVCFRFGEHPFNSELNPFSPAFEYGLFKFADVQKSKWKDNRITDVQKELSIDNLVPHNRTRFSQHRLPASDF
jgi:hypothetical protein